MASRQSSKKRRRTDSPRVKAALRENVRAFRREIILKTATDLFFDRGYERTSVDDLAAAMSVTKAVIYYNFSSKEDVLEAIVDKTLTMTREVVDGALATGKTPTQRLALLCFLYANHILEDKKMFGVYFREERSLSATMRRQVTALARYVDEKVAYLLQSGIARGEFRPLEPRLMSLTITGMISMAFYWHRQNASLPREALCRHFAEQALRLAGYSGAMDLESPPFELTADRPARTAEATPSQRPG
jgi:AcrR family transcriptional regulator